MLSRSQQDQLDAFLDAIKAEPREVSHRLVMGDWLYENGLDDHAAQAASWTPEKYAQAVAYMDGYVKAFHDDIDDWDPDEQEHYRSRIPDVKTLMEYAGEHLVDPEADRIYLNFDTPDHVYSGRRTFWEHFGVITGRFVPVGFDKTFIRCGC